MEVEDVLFAIIIVVCLALLMRALWRPPIAPAPFMSAPIEESLDQFANYPSELAVAGQRGRPNMQVAQCQNSYLIHSLLLLSILSCYVALYLLVCNGHIPEDDPIQEPIQCINTGNRVFVIGSKDYPPPAD